MPGKATPSGEYQGQEHDPTKKVPKQEDYEKEAEKENEPKEKQSRIEYEPTPKYYKSPKTPYQKWREKKYEKSYTKETEKLARAEARSKLEAIREARKVEIEAHPGKYREAGRTAITGTKRFIASYGYGKERYRAEMGGSDKAGKPRKNKAREFAKKQQPTKAYRPMTSAEPYDLNPRREYEFFGQPKEYNLVREDKKYDLGLGSGKKHDLGIGKKYDLGVGGKKLDLFGNGNGKKKKNDKFW
jgi:hypothetical protein